MYVLAQQVVCHCEGCQELPPEQRLMSCPQVSPSAGSGMQARIALKLSCGAFLWVSLLFTDARSTCPCTAV
jgi:hypothetical protein